jgi:exopolysaccharide biosynthesis polyprenyl glycosylphosphotransferase
VPLVHDPVAAAASALGSAVGSLAGSRSFSGWLRQWGLHVEVGLAFIAGVTVAFIADPHPYTALVALSVWLLGAYHSGRAVTTPLARQFRSLLTSATLPVSAVAAAVAFLSISPIYLSRAFTALAAAGLASVVCRTVRWRWQAPVRVVVVGDRAAVASATTRLARKSSVQLVGGLISEQGLERDATPREILGVPTVHGIDAARSLVSHWRADLVVVAPGAGITPETFRRITWALEGCQVAIGVSGLLESVAPHRITPGKLENIGLIDVRHPRPSTVVRGIKSASDRMLGAVLLALVSPVLLLMALAVRLDSEGSTFFTQTRVGREGRLFTVYKMRTMVAEADAMKTALCAENEFDSVLFKMKRDPRVTRVGRFLRKSSLDELPQLINVVRGEMSLVGPRPFLPEEVARMDADTLRRHAVQPGITGLWQVSGRSDLDWDDSAALDTYYADNWSLSGDAKIAARTVTAVLGGKGAY